MRKCFFAGVVTLLPVIITFIILIFCLNIITGPFEYFVNLILRSTHLFDHGLWIFNADQTIYYIAKLLIIIDLALFICLIGFLATKVVLSSWGKWIEDLMSKIPVIRHIYGPSKELVHTYFNPPAEVPRKAVLVPYPSENQLTVGIVTAEFTAKLYGSEKMTQEYVSVLIPSTPNATGGYLCSFLRSDVKPFDLPAEEALKYIMSFASNNSIAIKE